MTASPTPPWYKTAFRQKYLELYRHRDLEDARRAIAFVRDHAPLTPGARALDLCCGVGRHLFFLAPLLQPGRAVGLDLSRDLLRHARRALQADPALAPLRPSLVEADMRRLPFRPRSFDLALNLFTSFGYFEAEAENESVLAEIARVLRPAALLVLDHINRNYLEATLDRRTERRLHAGVRVLERRSFDPASRRVHKRILWTDPNDGDAAWDESVRVYDPAELQSALLRSGLQTLSRFGDYDGSPLRPDSPRMILIAKKTEGTP